MRLNEAVAAYAGVAEATGRKPDGTPFASPVLLSFAAEWARAVPDRDRQAMREFVPLLAKSGAGDEAERRRLWAIRDWALRCFVPPWLEHGGWSREAGSLRDAGAVRAADDAERIGSRLGETANAVNAEVLDYVNNAA